MRCALLSGVQPCSLPISFAELLRVARVERLRRFAGRIFELVERAARCVQPRLGLAAQRDETVQRRRLLWGQALAVLDRLQIADTLSELRQGLASILLGSTGLARLVTRLRGGRRVTAAGIPTGTLNPIRQRPPPGFRTETRRVGK